MVLLDRDSSLFSIVSGYVIHFIAVGKLLIQIDSLPGPHVISKIGTRRWFSASRITVFLFVEVPSPFLRNKKTVTQKIQTSSFIF